MYVQGNPVKGTFYRNLEEMTFCNKTDFNKSHGINVAPVVQNSAGTYFQQMQLYYYILSHYRDIREEKCL